MTEPCVYKKLQQSGKPYPRTCPECKLGPCKHPIKSIDAQPVPVEPEYLIRLRNALKGFKSDGAFAGDKDIVDYIDSLQQRLQVAQWNASKFQSLAQANQKLVEVISKRAESAEAALKVAQQERDNCYASFDNARRRLHEIEAFVTGDANDYRINEKLKDDEKSIKSLIEHLMAMADNYHTVNQLYIQAKERAEKAEALAEQCQKIAHDWGQGVTDAETAIRELHKLFPIDGGKEK